MNDDLRHLVWSRARRSCEYCRMLQEFDPLPFAIDHIRSQYHHGPTEESNLALACFNCNTFKGTNVAGHDPETGDLTPLFNPRKDRWSDHFKWIGAELVGKTAIGRTTIDVLRINLTERLEQRRLLIEAGVSLLAEDQNH